MISSLTASLVSGIAEPVSSFALAEEGSPSGWMDPLQGQQHDGRSIPPVLYRFFREDELLELSYRKRARFVTKRIHRHLRYVSCKLNAMDEPYESMTPFSLSFGEEATPDTSVHVELGLVYRVLSVANGCVQSSLLYTFYVPIDFLEIPTLLSSKCQETGDHDQVDGPDCFHDDDDCQDETDGTPAARIFQKDGNPQLLICLGVDSGLASPSVLTVNHRGQVSCLEASSQYRPAQFMLLNDNSYNKSEKHIVSILCLGLGPNHWFLAISQDRKGSWRFQAEEVMEFFPKNDKFHFLLTLNETGLIRLQAIAGDQRFLAFGCTGEQVELTEKDINSTDKLYQTLFSFSAVLHG